MLKARVGVKTCHDGSLYYEQKHIYTLCTPMSIFDCLPLDCKLGMNAEFHLRRLCIWYAKMARVQCVLQLLGIFLRQPNTSDVICLCLCLAGKQET